ncbi:MAG: M15 family metallopeptidase [Acidimicrobiia bacterium]
MSPPTPRRRLAVLLALALLVPLAPGVAGASDGAPDGADGADGAAPEDSVPEPSAQDLQASAIRPFLVVPGVDLAGLGYDGIPLDADVIERGTAELPSDPRERVAEISTRLDLLQPQLDGLRAAEAVLAGTLARFDPAVGELRRGATMAAGQADEAARRVDTGERRVRARAAELSDHRRRMAEVAVAAYMRPPGADALDKALEGVAAATDDLAADVLFTAKADHDGVVRDDLEVRLALSRARLRSAVVDADAARRRVAAAEALLADAEARREAHRQALAQVAAARSTLEEALPRLREDMDRTIEETWGSLEALAAGEGVAEGAIVNVAGIRIHAAIAPKLQALLAAAHADGVPLGGWGYRSTHQQIELRRKHCGPTPEDIFLKPSSQCSPPTARPGASMHERGLAVDFHLAGSSISTRQSPGYQWLAANAATFGFFNLPSEPWHWSVNAQ